MRLLWLCAATAMLCAAQDSPRIRAHVKFLASDLLEGRGVGVRGGALTEEYLATQLALAGVQPAGTNGTYFQDVPLVGVAPAPGARLSAQSNGHRVDLKWLDEFVGYTMKQVADASISGDVVFMGHGITAPEYGWDDYKDADVRGKVVVVFTGEPPSEDPKFFGGRALTYYGRWTYKYEEAARRGAAACLIVHTSETAGYGYDVVKSSWGREDMQVKLEPSQPALAFAGWVSQEAGDRILGLAGKTSAQLLALADERGFEPIPLPIRIAGTFPAKVRTVTSRNVIGIVRGRDARLGDEAVVFSAHWDHLGAGGAVNGDSIYNGAVDNATGCGMVLEMARAWQALDPKPRRSAIFLFVTAEENGLRGSAYYASHPVIPASKTALNLNFDAFYPFGRTADVVVAGAERTTAWPMVQSVARRFRLQIKPDPRPEQGSYYRSDHFSMARAGIPAFSVRMGNEFRGKPQGYGDQTFGEYNSRHYHQPSDEYQESWDFSGIEEISRFGLAIGLEAANAPTMPTWQAGDEFLPAREESMRQ